MTLLQVWPCWQHPLDCSISVVGAMSRASFRKNLILAKLYAMTMFVLCRPLRRPFNLAALFWTTPSRPFARPFLLKAHYVVA